MSADEYLEEKIMFYFAILRLQIYGFYIKGKAARTEDLPGGLIILIMTSLYGVIFRTVLKPTFSPATILTK